MELVFPFGTGRRPRVAFWFPEDAPAVSDRGERTSALTMTARFDDAAEVRLELATWPCDVEQACRRRGHRMLRIPLRLSAEDRRQILTAALDKSQKHRMPAVSRPPCRTGWTWCFRCRTSREGLPW